MQKSHLSNSETRLEFFAVKRINHFAIRISLERIGLLQCSFEYSVVIDFAVDRQRQGAILGEQVAGHRQLDQR